MLSFSTLQLLFAWQAYVYGQLFFLGMMSVYLFFELLTNKATKHENLKLYYLFFVVSWLF
jgi:asparagine N-glycosylation enzyme membrane subunit Stt3